MKKFLLGLIFCFAFWALPQTVFAEEISSFHTDITIETDGIIAVVEAITYDFGREDRHGIFRNIPVIKTNQDGKKYILEYDNFSVTDQNLKPYKFSQTKENGFIKLKIGDPDRTITGEHIYLISYTVSGALTYFSDHTELYWNTTGNDWDVVIDKASAVVRLPDTVGREDLDVTCYTGVTGSTDRNCDSDVTGVVAVQTATQLVPYNGLTVVVGFPRGLVSLLEPDEYVEFWETPLGRVVGFLLLMFGAIAAIIWYIITPGWLIHRWYTAGRDPRPPMGIASAWFEAPKTKTARKLSPGETGTLVDEQADLRDIFATIVDLARRGYLKIIENKKNDYSLMKVTDAVKGDSLQDHEQKLMSEFFNNNDVLKIKGSNLVDEVKRIQDSLYKTLVHEDFFPENPKLVRDKYILLSVAAMFTLNFPLFLIAITFGQAMPRKTMRGAQEANVARSLKNFLSSQEEKLEFQAKNYMFFERFLPFAIAFGVEKVWADRFKDVDMKQPDWYVGSTHQAHFSTAAFTRSLNSSFSGVTSAATPTRSSSGFSSGFSGGSSGGGGGGGGGGSW